MPRSADCANHQTKIFFLYSPSTLLGIPAPPAPLTLYYYSYCCFNPLRSASRVISLPSQSGRKSEINLYSPPSGLVDRANLSPRTHTRTPTTETPWSLTFLPILEPRKITLFKMPLPFRLLCCCERAYDDCKGNAWRHGVDLSVSVHSGTSLTFRQKEAVEVFFLSPFSISFLRLL